MEKEIWLKLKIWKKSKKMNKKKSLKNFNTFRVDVFCDNFLEIKREQDLISFFEKNKRRNFLILGGGSNILFSKNFKGTILKNKLKGIKILKKENGNIFLEAGSGENWHNLVYFCMRKNFWGLENLALIPGEVGGAVFGNIGAYGLEIKDKIFSVEVYDMEKKKTKVYKNTKKFFSYRNSYFKKNRGRFFILKVVFKLSEKFEPILRYKDLKEVFKNKNKEKITGKNIFEAVVKIRKKKLPDLQKFPNNGSFFKNPEISKKISSEILKIDPEVKFWEQENGKIKISAGYLIESIGFKRKKIGNVGTYQKHALVLINFGEAKGSKIKKFSEKIKREVFKKYGILLEEEVFIV